MDTKAVPDTRRHPRQARQAPSAQRFGLRVGIFKSEQMSNYDIARGRSFGQRLLPAPVVVVIGRLPRAIVPDLGKLITELLVAFAPGLGRDACL